MVAGESPAQPGRGHETPAPGPDAEWDAASLAALAAAPVDWAAELERKASTMEVEILTPALLALLDKDRELAEFTAAHMQHAQVEWAAYATSLYPLITHTPQESP